MNDLVRSQRFHSAMFTVLSGDKEMKRVDMQNRMVLELDQKSFNIFHDFDESLTTVKKYYKLRGLCSGNMSLWFFNPSKVDTSIETEMQRMREFHMTLLSEFTEEHIFRDDTRTFYLRGDQDRPLFDDESGGKYGRSNIRSKYY